MTSSSPRKPRTTPPSTRSRSEPLLGLLVALAFGLVATADEWRTFLRQPEAGAEAAVESGAQGAEGDEAAHVTAAPGGPAENEESGIDLVAGTDDDESTAEGPCADEGEDCREALKRLREDRLAGIDLDIRVGGRPGNDYPCECRLEGETFEPRRFATTMFTWKAAGYCHKPLYFEDWQLERYGHSHGPLADPFFSAAHFFVTLPVLPYKMGVELPWECVYPLGYYRPGNCAPWTVPAIPISLRGMAVEAATVTGLVFLFP
jgi:hypothetical protein